MAIVVNVMSDQTDVASFVVLPEGFSPFDLAGSSFGPLNGLYTSPLVAEALNAQVRMHMAGSKLLDTRRKGKWLIFSSLYLAQHSVKALKN